MHVYVWEYIVSLYYRTAKGMFTKLGRDEMLMVIYKYCCYSARSVPGRIQGGAKYVTGGPLLQLLQNDKDFQYSEDTNLKSKEPSDTFHK